MKKIYSAVFSLALMAGLASCEMKNEIWGEDKANANSGELALQLSNNANVVTRLESTDNGTKTGVFDPAEVNVQNYTLEITGSTTGDIKTMGVVGNIGGNNGVLSMTLDQGMYIAKAYNYDGSNVSVSTRPYFLGQKEFQILPGKTTNVPVECKLQNIEVGISLAQSFKDSFLDDYAITVDNGAGGVQVITKNEINNKYYFMVPEGKSSISVSIKATTTAGINIQRTYTITKPADAENNTDLMAGDAFVINIKEDNSTLSYIDFGMTVDFSFAEQEELFEIPTDKITFTEGGTTDPDPTPDDPDPTPDAPDTENSIVISGLKSDVGGYVNPHTTGETVCATINAPEGIQHIYLDITSNNTDFDNACAEMHFTHFDVTDPDATAADNLSSLGISYGSSIIGSTAYSFDVTSFMVPLALYTPIVANFKITVVDQSGKEKSDILKVTMQ